MTPEEERVYGEVLESLKACRERLAKLGQRYGEKTIVEGMRIEAANERELLLQLERLARGLPLGPGLSVWERVKKPEV